MVKIESGLGEKLNHLDETYKGIRESFDNRFTVKDAKKELKEEEQEVKKILKDKGDLVNELIDKANFEKKKITIFLMNLAQKKNNFKKPKQK